MEASPALASLSFRPLQPSVNPNILIYEPTSPATPALQSAAPTPRVIILATWLGGCTSSRIAVYCRGYQLLYPSTPILLIRTILSDITSTSTASLQDRLSPARDYLVRQFDPQTKPATDAPRVHYEGHEGALLHIFSHGGCNTALQLSRLMRDNVREQALPIPLLGVILDSCPGTDGFIKAYRAAAYSLPKSLPFNLFGHVLLIPFIGTVTVLQSLGISRSIHHLRDELNETQTFGPVPRLYLHSKGDLVVAAEDVSSHADRLAASGVEVVRETWKTAMHCALPTEDSKRYWDVIAAFVAKRIPSRLNKL